jgi:hypothetical protein
VLAYAIAWAGDAIARAYATAHVHAKDANGDPRPPALEEAAKTVAAALAGGGAGSSMGTSELAGSIAVSINDKNGHRAKAVAIRWDAQQSG